MLIDDELKELAALALRNAFYTDFSDLVNVYLAAAEGLDVDTLEMQMGESTSIYGRDTEAKGDAYVNIWTPRQTGPTGHDTILGALSDPEATEVRLSGKRVFKKKNGEWYFDDQTGAIWDE